jgi:23S rRNA (cytidine1920-2'-O)/16S rRNA (cytidine1409-2'-O)-methyltransferase
MERRNARFMEPGWFDGPFDFASIDVSFISLKLILPPLKACLKRSGQVVALIKPQFEAGRGQVGKNGVVREPSIHRDVCINIIRYAQQIGYRVEDLSFSPITGPKGNIEFLLFLRNGDGENSVEPTDFEEKAARIVEDSHKFHINC